MVGARQSIARVIRQSQTNYHICSSCRRQLSRTPISIQQQRLASNYNALSNTAIINSESRPGLLGKIRNTLRREAAQPPPVAEENPENYDQSETWDGLEFVGSTGSWRDVPPQPEDSFYPWMDPEYSRAKTRNEIVSSLHRALVECLACAQAGSDPSIALKSGRMAAHVDHAIESATIHHAGQGAGLQVQFALEEHQNEFLDAINTLGGITESDPAASSIRDLGEQPSDEELQLNRFEELAGSQRYVVSDQSFLALRLDMEDANTFHILKRFSQLSGHRIPDPVLNTFLTSGKPLSFLIESIDEHVLRPKPKKLAEILLNTTGLTDQANVMVFPRRETPVDKEKEVGRWKVIEKELIDRGLPLPGTTRVTRKKYRSD